MKPRVGLDLDGVVYKFAHTYRYMMNLHRGLSLPPVEEFWDSWNAPDAHTTPEDRKWIWTDGIEHGLFRHGHIYKGAVEGVQRLCAASDVVVITSRPKSAVPDTLQWLAFHRFPIAELHIIGATPKSAVKPECDFYVDDSADNAADLHDNTRGRVLLWDRSWNQDFQEADRERVQRVASWPEVIVAVSA